ncbi:MFS transporter [Glycomyces niveus]|uniref:MFS transporter n=1 Tax=Glycomyces niveus TaxID=2820287 RepID=A0ABS3U423_9ACTN|nr:MFS transporter [Glycomyces sp. NEAU-S30]MBO3733524.1 MFS transporter [Glycomyces sp. NEAU-S30]
MTLDLTPAPARPAAAPKGFIVRAALSNWGLWTALMTPSIITLAVRVEAVAGADYEAVYAMVLSVGAAVGMFGGPVWGRLSDATRSRFGRRRPWIAGGIAAGTAGIAVIAFVPQVWALVFGWALAQAGFNAALAGTMASVPDQVPAKDQGQVSGAFGAAVTGGILAGSGLAALTQDTRLMFMIPCALAIALAAQFVLGFKDPQVEAPREPFSLKAIGATFVFDPRRHPDFGWVWLAKFLLVFGGAAPMVYMVYFTAARLDLTPAEASGVVGVLFLASYALQTAVALGGGWLSDRIGRRRPLFVASGLISAAGLILLATASNLPMIVAAQLVLSVSGGLFAAVDAVLVFQTLPNPDAPAKDLGVANLANGFPQVLLPLAATAVLAVGGGENYALLFAAAAAVAVCGALSVLRVKRVR